MLIAIGITTIDLFVSGLDRIPNVGGDEFTTSNLAFCDEALAMVLGGNGANTAYVAARLGLPAMLCSAVGRDALSQVIDGWLNDVGVDTRGVLRSDEAATATTTVITDQALNRLAFHHRGASEIFSHHHLPPAVWETASILLISGYPLLPAWRPDGVAETLAKARQAGITTAMDIGPAIGEPARLAELQPMLSSVDYFLCNAHELAECTGTNDIDAGMMAILDAGTKCVVIKQGRDGALIREADFAMPLVVPGFAVEARFTVGAGDSFNAGFLYGLSQGWDLQQATQFANAYGRSGRVIGTGGVGKSIVGGGTIAAKKLRITMRGREDALNDLVASSFHRFCTVHIKKE